MIGPLVATAALSTLGAPTASLTPLRKAGQWVIGAALGLYFTPRAVALVAGLWWAVVLNVVWALALGLAFGAWPHRARSAPGRLYFAGLPRLGSAWAFNGHRLLDHDQA